MQHLKPDESKLTIRYKPAGDRFAVNDALAWFFAPANDGLAHNTAQLNRFMNETRQRHPELREAQMSKLRNSEKRAPLDTESMPPQNRARTADLKTMLKIIYVSRGKLCRNIDDDFRKERARLLAKAVNQEAVADQVWNELADEPAAAVVDEEKKEEPVSTGVPLEQLVNQGAGLLGSHAKLTAFYRYRDALESQLRNDGLLDDQGNCPADKALHILSIIMQFQPPPEPEPEVQSQPLSPILVAAAGPAPPPPPPMPDDTQPTQDQQEEQPVRVSLKRKMEEWRVLSSKRFKGL
jgi:hypothetical protein